MFFNRRKKKASMKRHPSQLGRPLEMTKINNSTFWVDIKKIRKDGE